MATANATFTEMVTTTLRAHRKEIADNVSNHNALHARMTKKGNKETEDGGYEIVMPLDYAENSTYQRYSGYEVLNVQASEVLSAAKYDWKQAAVHVAASGRELRQNSGKNALIKLASARLKNAMRTAANQMSSDLYSDGTEDGGKQIGGLQAIVADDGLGTVGGINSSTFSFWQNKVQSAASPLQGGAGITPSSSTMASLMHPLWLELVRGTDKPDLIISSNNYFQYFWESLTDLQRYADKSDEATQGFSRLKYVTADVIHDGGSGIPDSHMYFLNTDYLKLVEHADAQWSEVEEMRPINQDSAVIPIIWMGNLCCSNRALQGVLKA
jgi:hypothetical protein